LVAEEREGRILVSTRLDSPPLTPVLELGCMLTTEVARKFP
jgi:hypothetical protein